jgi:hypothetical protein
MPKEDWLECNLPYGPIFHKSEHGTPSNELDSFSKRGLAIAGVLIRIKGKEVLIGHINEMRGICDDCTYFSPEEIVTHYKIVWKA